MLHCCGEGRLYYNVLEIETELDDSEVGAVEQSEEAEEDVIEEQELGGNLRKKSPKKSPAKRRKMSNPSRTFGQPHLPIQLLKSHKNDILN